MWDKLRNKFRDEVGATAVEYGIMVALIAVVIIGAVIALGTNLSERFQETADCIEEPEQPACAQAPGGGG
jgi:pilus assembly protein Flp/PilA